MARLLRQTLEDFDLQAADVDSVMNEIQARAEAVISRPDA